MVLRPLESGQWWHEADLHAPSVFMRITAATVGVAGAKARWAIVCWATAGGNKRPLVTF